MMEVAGNMLIWLFLALVVGILCGWYCTEPRGWPKGDS